MTRRPVEIVRALLLAPTDPAVVADLVAPDATYLSLNYENADLKRIMPWAGTHKGSQSIVETFVNVARHWDILAFDIEDAFGSEGKVAVFARCTFRSRVLGRVFTSPIAILAKVTDGKIVFLQFMEDTFGTASTFRSGGAWTFEADPDGQVVSI